MERRRLTPQQQLDVIRDVKLGMSRATAMKKYGIKWHSTLSQIITRRGHQVKVAKTAVGQSAAAAVLQKARCSVKPGSSFRCIIRKPQVSQISHIDPRTTMPDTTDPSPPATGQPEAAPLPAPQANPQTDGPKPTFALKLIAPRKIMRRNANHASMEERIDEALSRISKLNQKLMTRQGTSVFCSCCNRHVNFKLNTVTARVREHCITRFHQENISRTRQQRQQDRSEESPVNGSADSADDQPDGPVRFPFQRRRAATQRVFGQRLRRRRRNEAPAASAPTAEQEAAQQQEFERDLVQTFLETGVPVHKLNMSVMRDFFQKWTGRAVPRYEEKQLDYGF